MGAAKRHSKIVAIANGRFDIYASDSTASLPAVHVLFAELDRNQSLKLVSK